MTIRDPQHDFEREKVCYEQNFKHARGLNAQMNQIPTLAITLTGGLWFAAGLTEKLQPNMRFGLLLFAWLCDIGLVLAMIRVRDVFHSYLEKLKEFNPDSYVQGRPAKPAIGRLGAYSMVAVYALLMLCASLLSIVGAFAFYWPFAPRMRPVGIITVVGFYAILFTFLYGNWKRTLVVAITSVVGVVLAAVWILWCSGER